MSARELALLGRISDGMLARRLGISKTTVWKRRRELNIPACYVGPLKIAWTPTMLRDLGRLMDREFAERYGVSRSTAQGKRQEMNRAAKRRMRT